MHSKEMFQPGKLPVTRDDSDDDDLDGDTETADNGDPTDVKRAKRMFYRESAGRSRRRNQEQMSVFDTQVGQLRVEHSTLLDGLSDMNRKCDAATIDKRIIRVDIETLRTKVKIAKYTVKGVTGVKLFTLDKNKHGGIPLKRANHKYS